MDWKTNLTQDQIAAATEAKAEFIRIHQQASKNLGYILCTMKEVLPHGNFQTWYQDELKLSKQQASIYMRVYTCLSQEGLEVLEGSADEAIAIVNNLSADKQQEAIAIATTEGKLSISKARNLKVVNTTTKVQKPSYKQLEERVHQLEDENQQLKAELAKLKGPVVPASMGGSLTKAQELLARAKAQKAAHQAKLQQLVAS
jgi:Protein of unknown function (DUF3102)